MTDAPPLLSAEQVSKAYGSVVALRSSDLRVDAGEVHALLGANGAGKSTLVKILAGVVRADEGTIRLNGETIEPTQPREALAAGLGTVFQDPALVQDLTIEQNFRLTQVDPDRVRSWLDRMEMGTVDFDVLVKDVPLPVLRMLDLSRALAHEPQLLMLDEITAALPGDHVEVVMRVMRDWRDQGNSVLFITHRLGEVLQVCDRATVLRDGEDVALLDPREGGERRMIEAMLGEVADEVAAPGARREVPDDAPIALEARDLRSRSYLNGLSLELRAGEIVGLVGLEGQGEERLFDVLSGNRPFDNGELLVEGEPVRPRSPYDLVRKGVVLIPSDRLHALLPKRPVRENLASALYNKATRWLRLDRDEGERVEQATERLEIDMRAGREARRLSGGNQQKVVVGRWLTAGFQTLLCFDPTRGIDIRTKEQIYQLLRELADAGTAVLYYTSEFTEVPIVADRILVIYNGQIVAKLDPAAADEQTLLNAAHGLKETAQ